MPRPPAFHWHCGHAPVSTCTLLFLFSSNYKFYMKPSSVLTQMNLSRRTMYIKLSCIGKIYSGIYFIQMHDCMHICNHTFSITFTTPSHHHLSHTLTQPQAEEFRSLVEEEHFNWVAQYLVMKRASIEPNFHSLYIGFLDVYSSHTLRRVVLLETHRNIKVSMSAASVEPKKYLAIFCICN